jgi:hypothetical protein
MDVCENKVYHDAEKDDRDQDRTDLMEASDVRNDETRGKMAELGSKEEGILHCTFSSMVSSSEFSWICISLLFLLFEECETLESLIVSIFAVEPFESSSLVLLLFSSTLVSL